MKTIICLLFAAISFSVAAQFPAFTVANETACTYKVQLSYKVTCCSSIPLNNSCKVFVNETVTVPGNTPLTSYGTLPSGRIVNLVRVFNSSGTVLLSYWQCINGVWSQQTYTGGCSPGNFNVQGNGTSNNRFYY